jgi:DNA-binding NarL/FixJ family response regulator
MQPGRRVRILVGEGAPALNPADGGPSAAEEAGFAELLESREKKFKQRQLQVTSVAAHGNTSVEIVRALGCSETTVSNDKKTDRRLLEVS